jgi:hypothetical protein
MALGTRMVQPRPQPRKPVSFTSARRYSKDPGALWSRETPDFRGNSIAASLGTQGGVVRENVSEK